MNGDKVATETIRLDQMRVSETMYLKADPEIGTNFTSTAELIHEYQIDYDRLKLGIEAYVLQEHLAEDFYEGSREYVVHHSWWDMFKDTYATRWWATWFVRKHLPKFDMHPMKIRIKVDRYLNYPEANIQMPALGRPYPYERITRLEDRDET